MYTARDLARIPLSRVTASILLVIVTAIVYWPVIGFEFVNFDDTDYVSQNPHVTTGLSADNVQWAFTKTHSANWHPLTWISHMLDSELYGLNAGGHHLTNLCFHIANAILLFLLLFRTTGAHLSSLCVAALFALHPLHVESVAWVSERKDVLSTFFLMISLLAYHRYVRTPGVLRFCLVLCCFALGLLSKPMLVTFPFLLLLLDYWPLGRIDFRNGDHSFCRIAALSVEKFPFLLLSAISSIVTFQAQTSFGATVWYTFDIRAGNAIITYAKYLLKTVIPHPLTIFYPYPKTLYLWQLILSVLILTAATAWIMRKAIREKWLFVGWFWYLGTLVPVIGFVHVGDQCMADRYTYVPLIGIFIAFVWGIRAILEGHPRRRRILVPIFAILITGMSACSRFQVMHWRDSESLFRHALRYTRDNYLAHNNLGSALAAQRVLDSAAFHFGQTLRILPDYALGHFNLGHVFFEKGALDSAHFHFRTAQQLDSGYIDARFMLAQIEMKKGGDSLAEAEYRKILCARPDYWRAFGELALLMKKRGHLDSAVNYLSRAVELNPDFTDGIEMLGRINLQRGELQSAIQAFSVVIARRPKNPEGYSLLGLSLFRAGHLDAAVGCYSQALAIAPGDGRMRLHRGIVYAQQGKHDSAAVDYRLALEREPTLHVAHYQLSRECYRRGTLDSAQYHLALAIEQQPLNPEYLAWAQQLGQGTDRDPH